MKSSAAIEAVIRHVQSHGSRKLVAIDGRSGSGKSTLACQILNECHGVLVQGDDFYAAHVPDSVWDELTPAERADRGIDWRRIRSEAVEPLLEGRAAIWHPFDSEAGPKPDGTYGLRVQPEMREPENSIILDGAYSCRPEMADLVSLSVLVMAPDAVRRARLEEREEPGFLEAWHRRWDDAEEHYFTSVSPPSSFDIVVDAFG